MCTKHNKKNNLKLSLNNEFFLRKKKLSKLKKICILFPDYFKKKCSSKEIHNKYNCYNNQELTKMNIVISFAGRMMNRRIIGKAAFVSLQDIEGKLQLYITKDNVGYEVYYKQFKIWDLGDILGAKGKLFKTYTGELSIRCNEIILLTKSVRPFISKYHKLTDKKIRYRRRYLDLIFNKESRYVFKMRSLIISKIRYFMEKKGFIEVETPMIHNIPGGGIAKPFVTYNNALNTNMYLRIAPELYLKKLIVGGYEKIFEINKSFRNEGISSCHNPEFTTMELYIAYANYKDLIILLSELFLYITKKVLGTTLVEYQKYTFDFSKPFIQIKMKDAICNFHSQISYKDLNNIMKIYDFAKSLGIEVKKYWSVGKIQTEIFEKTIEKYLIQPTIITDYPVESSPLARRNNNDLSIIDRFELFIHGKEICNGFSEENDYKNQKKRFLDQIKINKNENNLYDKEYIVALEYGLPPTAGLGIGIDRLLMLLTNQRSIKDVIFFPTLKSEE